MSTRPTTAMVLAAGLGTRMRPLTEFTPKPLVSVAGKALIDHMLDRLVGVGVTRAVVNVHYRADQLEAHLRMRTAPEIVVSDERAQLMETGGGLVQARALLGDDPIFVTNTDQILHADQPDALGALAAAWDDLAMDALLLLAPRAHSLGYDGAGDFFCAADGRLGRRGGAAQAPFAYTGVQILHPRCLAGWPCAPFSTNRIWDQALARARLFGVVMSGTWMHVGDPGARDAAEAILSGA
ncbi:MAG: nucleotidyltransferase family protein [Caulobacterales bacterium]